MARSLDGRQLVRPLHKKTFRTGGETGRRSGFTFPEEGAGTPGDAANRPVPETRGSDIERVDGVDAHSMPNRATVEDALAFAIARASAAGQWAVVAQLARELEARRLAAASVVSLTDRQRSRST